MSLHKNLKNKQRKSVEGSIEIERENDSYKEIEYASVALDVVHFKDSSTRFEVYIRDEYDDAIIFEKYDEAFKYFETF